MVIIVQTSDLGDTVISMAIKQRKTLNDNTCCHGVVQGCVRVVNHLLPAWNVMSLQREESMENITSFNRFINLSV